MVCCSMGDIPDLRPKPNPDGTCASYTVVTDDSGSKISGAVNITGAFEVDISGVDLQFKMLKSMTSIKRILSFGGQYFSTQTDTYPIFRQGVTDANRQKFARSAVDFIIAHGLDVVDFDWEYPGAPDIPGIPPGSQEDGANYVKFLKMVRAILPKHKSLSIAALASFWYS